MVAPIDAKATFDVDGEPITLVMNFRTIALAEDEAPDVVTAFGSGKPKLSGMATLVWAFARPAHPDLTLDDALAIVMRHGKAAGEALGKVFAAASAAVPKGGAGGEPAPRPRTRRSTP